MVYSSSSKAILKTIIYKNIFHFPLSKYELWRFLISDTKISKTDFESALSHLPKEVSYQDGFYFLKGKEEIIKKRKKNLNEAKKKLRIAQTAAHLISFIPTVSLIGLSGGAAVGNVLKEDDVDLFIITKRGTLFMTRFWILLLLESAGLRRKSHEKHIEASNKVCVNLLIDESALSWPRSKRDLYVAHEIAQMKPLFERDDMYRQFINSNKWVNTFLPNVLSDELHFLNNKSVNNYYILAFITLLIRFSPLPVLVEFIQKVSMKKKQTTEVIKNNILAFHPYDYRRQTLNAYIKLTGDKLT